MQANESSRMLSPANLSTQENNLRLTVHIPFAAVVVLSVVLLPAAATAQAKSDQAWIARSNGFTNQLIDITNRYSPEEASRQGLTKYDTKIGDPARAAELAERKDKEAAVAKLIKALASESDPNVVEDLHILISKEQLGFRQQDYRLNHEVPYINATMYIYQGLEPLLDAQAAGGRHHAAIERMDRYVGINPDPGGSRLTELPSIGRTAGPAQEAGNLSGGNKMGLYVALIQRMIEQAAKPNVVYPSRQEIETQLARNPAILKGIGELFEKNRLNNWQNTYVLLQKQMDYYDNWVRTYILPRARSDFRLPPEEYALNFESYGIDIPPAQIAEMAHKAFADYQAQMAPIAADIAKQRGYKSSNYRDVIAELKKEQIAGEAILPFYEKRLHEIEAIIVKEHLVTLPDRAAIIRLGTPAESAQQPAPHMVPPPFLHNTGQRGVFVLPLTAPAGPGSAVAAKVDDYAFDAASWTLIAHEARPGHELQFDSMVEHGVSLARALYAFNSTNAEGWGLYAEYITLPSMPKEGQLISLQFRLLRAARAFLDPELQAGKVKPHEAMDVLTHEVGLSVPFANQEVERYTFRAPGQANSYFYGFTRLLELRHETEQALGSKFDALRFHDFLLAQGLLPPSLMKKAVEEHFIPQEKSRI